MPAKIPTVEIAKGVQMPVIGLGTYFQPEVGDATKWAIDAGYRLIDTVELYKNEEDIGKALKETLEKGVVKREELFILSKVWSYHHREDEVVEACKNSLKKLQLDYLDLYLIHLPIGLNFHKEDVYFPYREDGVLDTNDIDYLETWRGMEKCVELGLTKSIGISNFNSRQIERILSVCKIKPSSLQVELNPHVTQKELLKYCKEKNIAVIAYTPIGRPNLQEKTPNYIFDDRVLAIAQKYGKTATQIILRYLIDCGACPIPRSVNKQRIESNIDIFDFNLTPEEISVIDSFNANKRFCKFTDAKGHKYHFLGPEDF
ncbi:aldo-keto reductase AKR2E4-like isoform X2 [Phlebotomus papatasi]|uniref:aldo-keto reductase AKR2E4-like isoform X2 n=1 Tax=Phlebotomus papatasi TaxID=29031 RepID=UPI002484577C|nr:aldo-keto reductase AKR2E4-like isoform X2 [Phlebotomus papatasi]